jgi:hypothetical protein
MEKLIQYCYRTAKVACDEKCNKAWGVQMRPKVDLDQNDPDDYYFLADDELGEAPVNPGTYEGDEGKPVSKDEIPNKWCVRQCERCSMSAIGKHDEPLELRDWNKRSYNIPSKHLKIGIIGGEHIGSMVTGLPGAMAIASEKHPNDHKIIIVGAGEVGKKIAEIPGGQYSSFVNFVDTDEAKDRRMPVSELTMLIKPIEDMSPDKIQPIEYKSGKGNRRERRALERKNKKSNKRK